MLLMEKFFGYRIFLHIHNLVLPERDKNQNFRDVENNL